MRITVIGAGTIGAAVARVLAARPNVTLVQVCDARARALQKLHEQTTTSNLRSFQVDARDHATLYSILRGSDMVVACVDPELNPGLARLCLDLGIHYGDLGGNDKVVRKVLALHEEARERAVWIVPNCGLAPGLVNILCHHGIDQFDEPEAAFVRVGDVPLNPEPPFNFRVSWSASKMIDDYTHPVQLVEDGEVREHDSLTQLETIAFPEPFGQMEAFCTAGGLSTLARELAGRVRFLDHKAVRWPGHAHQMRFLLGLGFGEDRTIDVRTHLTYRDVLQRKLKQRLGGTYADAVLLRVVVQGRQDGQERSLVYEMAERYDAASEQTAMERSTSIPAAAVALLVGGRKVEGGGGALPPEAVVPRADYLRLVDELGVGITEHWHDGFVDPTQLPAMQAAA